MTIDIKSIAAKVVAIGGLVETVLAALATVTSIPASDQALLAAVTAVVTAVVEAAQQLNVPAKVSARLKKLTA